MMSVWTEVVAGEDDLEQLFLIYEPHPIALVAIAVLGRLGSIVPIMRDERLPLISINLLHSEHLTI
jgi:hypothetical protein